MLLFASYSGAFGGAERLLLSFAAAFEERCALACPEGPLASSARTHGMTVFPLRRFRPNVLTTPRDRALAAARLAAHSLELRRLLRDLDPDLVIAWGMRSALALLLGPRPEAPVVFQHNDLLPGGIRGRLVRGAAARASLCVALSGAIARDLGGPGLLRGRLRVVHPGIDVDRFAAAVSPASPPEVLFVGTIAGWKRPDLALEAIALVRRQRPDVVLRVVGAPLRDDGDALLSALRARAARPDLAGAVEFAGALDDAAAALARATCLLHCAPREPFGMAVLEALAAGRPAVVPAAEGPAEIVDEDCGRLYRPGDAAAAAGALLEVLSDERRAAEMGERGRERARVNFGLERARAEYRAAVEPLVRRRQVRRTGR